ncbi:MAG: polyhydroxybutyrate depolymerase [Candidatus Puniceispirillum sp.]|nr:polyhydroxybutyrate depolymerase [Candidatus Puniceispirillum sp.]
MTLRYALWLMGVVFCSPGTLFGATGSIETQDGRTRTYTIDKPSVSDPKRLMPVIIMLHGGGGDDDTAKTMTGLSDAALPKGFMVVYPNGTGKFERIKKLKTWNAGHCCGYAMDSAVDDVGFIDMLIDQLISKEGADPARIFVTGMSNGAMLTHRVGARLCHKIAAIAPVVGGLFGDEKVPKCATSVLTINGALDYSVPLEGGLSQGRAASAWDGTPLKAASYQGAFWAKANGCDPVPDKSDQKDVSVTHYRCPKGIDVIRYVVAQGGHAWPGGRKGSSRGDTPTQTLDATQLIIQFFEEHPRGAARVPSPASAH